MMLRLINARNILVFGFAISFLFIIGCHSSQEMERGDDSPKAPAPAEVNPRSLNVLLLKDCKEENDSLLRVVSKLQQDLRGATARAAEMETQLAELKDHPAPPPVEEKKPVVKASKVEERKPVVKAPKDEEARPVVNIPDADDAKPAMATPASSEGNSAYEEGLSMFRSRKFHDALMRFESISPDGGGSGLADRGTYWSGECRYALKDYSGALDAFKKVLGYKNSTKKDDAQMMIGNCYLSMGNKSQAKAEFQKLVSQYPVSPYVKRAKVKLNGM